MAWVETRITRTTQPQDAVGIDANGWGKAVAAWLPSGGSYRPIAISRGNLLASPTVSGITVAATAKGTAWVNSTGSINAGENNAAIGSEISFLALVQTSAPGDFCSIFSCKDGTFGGWEFRSNGSNRIQVVGNNTQLVSSSAPINDGKFHVLCGSLSASASAVWVDGVKNTGSGAGVNGGGNAWGVLARPNGSQSFAGSFVLGAIFTGVLSDAEIKSLSDNPWQIFEPEVSRIWVDDYVSAGGGATTVTTDASASYTVAGSVQADATAAYAIRSAASADATASYKIASAVTQDATAQYAIRAAVTADASASYSLIAATSVTADASASYVVRGAVQQDASASYAVRAAVFADAVASYALIVDGQVTADASGSYQIRGAVQSDASLAYEIAGAVQASASASYVVQGMASADASAAYVVQGAVVADAVGSYFVDGEYVPSTTPGAQTRPSRLQSSSRPSRLQTGTRASR